MQPRIDGTRFGSVTIDGQVYEHDVVIRLGGKVEKRKKKLSKAVHGTSHIISSAEAKHVHQNGATLLLIGAGQSGTVRCRRKRPPISNVTAARCSCCRRHRSSRSGTRPTAP